MAEFVTVGSSGAFQLESQPNYSLRTTHEGGQTVFYSTSPRVSTTINDGSLVTGGQFTFTGKRFFITQAGTGTQGSSASLRLDNVPVTGETANVPTVYYAHDYGVMWDGATNDSAALQSLIGVVYAAGGGIIDLPRGTGLANVVLYPRVHLRGQGRRVTTLKSFAAGGDVVKGLNFDTLASKVKATGDYALGCYEAAVTGMTVDGNKATQTAGYGVRLWGRANVLDDLEVINCKNDGVWLEFTDVDSFLDTAQVLESQIGKVIVHGCDGNGWTHRGPHDTTAEDITCWANGGWGMSVELSAGSYNGSIAVRQINVYLNLTGGVRTLGGASINTPNGQFTGDVGVGLDMSATSGNCVIRGVVGAPTGLILRGDNHVVHVQAVNCTTDAIKIDGANRYHITANGNANQNVFNVVTDGQGTIFGRFDCAAGKTLKSGAAWSTRSTVDVVDSGAAGNTPEFQLPSNSLKNPNGYSPVLPDDNGTLLTARTKAGIPADGDFPSTPANGTVVGDTTNNRIYIRVGGVWKYAALT